MKRSWIALLVVAVFFSRASSQVDRSIPEKDKPSQLKAQNRISVTSEKVGIISGSTKCDSQGNVYFREYEVDRPHLSPVINITVKGERKAIFAPSAFTNPPLTDVAYFNISPGGDLYWPGFAADRKAIYVVSFNKDGSPKSEVKLDQEFIPFQFAAFKSGELLLAGVKLDDPSVAGTERPFTAIFSSSGKLLKRFSLQDDDYIMQAAKRGDVSVVSPVNPTVIRALNLGEAASSDDGNVYLLRHLSPAIIYAISPAGNVVRRISLETPGGLMPIAMQASRDSLALVFWDNDTETGTVKVLDSGTGRETASYAYGDPLGPAFACFRSQPDAFSFLTGNKETLVLVHAAAH